MRNLLFAVTAVGSLLGASVAASADQGTPRTWYILDFSNGECHTTASATHGILTNPEQWHRQLRRGGVVDEVRVVKDDEGNATVVMITADFGRGSPTTNVFFPSLGECELGKKLAEAGGFLPDFKSLR